MSMLHHKIHSTFFCFLFWLCSEACRTLLAPDQEWNLGPSSDSAKS